jgi:hypothetical protein
MLNTITDFIDGLKESELGRRLLLDQQQRRHLERQAIVDERAKFVNERRPAIVAAHDRAIGPLKQAADAAHVKAVAAADKLLAVQRAKTVELGTLDAKVERLTNQLVASADSTIEEARRAMMARWEASRASIGRDRDVRTGDLDRNGRFVVRHVSNSRAVRRLLDALATARNAFDLLKIENPVDIDAAIRAIEAPVNLAWDAIGELDEPVQAA